jgi:hypothetical protein
MTPQRSHAYGLVMRTLEDLGPAKLLEHEQDGIRHAADSMVFSRDLATSHDARRAYRVIEELAARLVDSGRWTAERAGRLLDDVWSCGPGCDAAARVAA